MDLTQMRISYRAYNSPEDGTLSRYSNDLCKSGNPITIEHPLDIFDQWMKKVIELGKEWIDEPNAMSLSTVSA